MLRAAGRTIDALCHELEVIGVDEALARAAGELAERRGLRGYDAVHLASATAIDHPELVVATWDRDLAAAVVALDQRVVPAEH
jgi:uncharacterized protein